MIIEAPTHGRLLQGFLSIIGGNHGYDLVTNYTIPETVLHTQAIEDVSIHFIGNKANAVVALGREENTYTLNGLLPERTIFELSSTTSPPCVTTHVESRKIVIPAQKAYQDILPFALLNAIARLKYHHQHPHGKEAQKAADYLDFKLGFLKMYGYIPEGRTDAHRKRDLDAWRVFCDSEKTITLSALELARNVAMAGVNVFPKAKNYRQIANIVNSEGLLRGYYQRQIHPSQVPGRRLGISLGLSLKEVADVLIA